MSESEKQQVKELTILAIENNPLFRRKLFKKVLYDNPKEFYNNEWKKSTHDEKLDFLEDVLIFDKSTGLTDFLFLLSTYSNTKDKKLTMDLFRRYKNE